MHATLQNSPLKYFLIIKLFFFLKLCILLTDKDEIYGKMALIQAYCGTDKGRKRSVNQDRCGWLEIVDGEECLIIDADGMGGHSAGELAAEFAVEEFLDAFRKKHADPVKTLKDAFSAVISRLKKHIKSNPDHSDMGTTLSAALLYNKHIYTLHIGDSRIYKIDSSGLTQISEDHSYVRELVRAGVLSEELAEQHPDNNILTKAVNALTSSEPDLYDAIKAEKGDAFLVCSDGLWKMTSKEDVAGIVGEYNAKESVERLIDLANQNGGEDNISLALMKIIDI